MKESKQSGWNCMSSMFNNTEEILLLKKKQSKDNRMTSNRSMKAEESKPEIQNKINKKSLKKRSASANIASDVQIFQQQLNETHKHHSQTHANFSTNLLPLQSPMSNQQHMNSVGNNLFTTLNNHRNLPYNQIGVKQREYQQQSHIQSSVNLPSQSSQQYYFNCIPQNSAIYNQERANPSYRKIGPKNYQNTAQNLYANNQMLQKEIQKSHFKLQSESKPNKLSISIHKKFETQNNEREDTEIIYQKQSIIIQDTQSLLKFRDESRHQSILSKVDFKDKNLHQFHEDPIVPHKIVMKITNSDYQDGKDSQSQPSEVIGKNFDNNYQDFWQKDQVYKAQQTASRSTNTKLSTFYNINRGLMSMSQEMKPAHTFGTSHNFKSYKYL